jgi:hypothetical protein
MKTEIGPNIMRLARKQQRLAQARIQRERELQDERIPADIDAIPVFDRGRDPLVFAVSLSDDPSDWS